MLTNLKEVPIMLRQIRHVVVESGEFVLVHRDGRLEDVLKPGRYPHRRRNRYQVVDARLHQLVPSTQEVPTADGAQIKVTVVVTYRVVDPVDYTEVALDPLAHVYLATQVALRDAFAGVDAEVAAERGRADPEIAAGVARAVVAKARPLGVEVLDVQLKDVILPHELRAAAMELVTARSRGLAKLEEARAETAALRSLANAAKLLDEHPALARIRLLQAAPSGSKLVLSVDPER